MAHSGVNPHGGFTEFVKKDPLENIDVHRDAKPPPPDLTNLATKWAIGTQKYTAKTGKVLPDGHVDRSAIHPRDLPRNPTDNISF